MDPLGQLPDTMLAAINRKYGPPEVVKVESIPCPRPKVNEILIKVRAATVSTGDWRLRSLTVPKGFGIIMRLIFGFRRPKYHALGTDLGGEVVAVGKSVSKFKVGDLVAAHQAMRLGGHAEYCALPDSCPIVIKPHALSFEQAAALSFGGLTALTFLRDKAKLRPGEKLLVIGAAGAVGSAAVQLGKYMGARVSAVTSTDHVELLRELGADTIIDRRKVNWLTQAEAYDVIFDTVGSISYDECAAKLNPSGRFLMAVADLRQILSCAWISLTQKKKAYAGGGGETSKDLQLLADLAVQGRFLPLISEVLPLARIVEAHRIVESGHKIGNVVITMAT